MSTDKQPITTHLSTTIYDFAVMHLPTTN